MRFTVTWNHRTQNELADLWANADSPSRQAITRASHHIDQLLADDPELVGESRSAGRRVLFERPLAVLFEVSEPDRLVTVLHVWLTA